jgi:hypothetical protein
VPCFACLCLVRPGQVYDLTIEREMLCADGALTEGGIRVRDALVVEVKRGKAEMEVFPGEFRHLVNALAEAAARLVHRRAQEG